ncbi:3-dehydroquinate synthase [Neisseriaceae bacterium B1]
MNHQLNVVTSSHSYPIYIGSQMLTNFQYYAPHISKKVFIVTNPTVAAYYLEPLQNLFTQNQIEHHSIILNDGEQYKNHDSLNHIYNELLSHHADRKSTLIALGGGVIGDITGFAAATYQRGIPFIQIPTTLLSQVDSSVGGKTAINHPLGKNMIGAFYQPQAVIADLDTLNTLPEREFSAGMAEVIKYALLGDVQFLAWLENSIATIMYKEPETLTIMVKHCCQMKADIVAQDETEQDFRALLNLGHTFGHAIETEMGYGVWLHGEAIAAGMVLAAKLSEQLGNLKASDTERIRILLQQAKLPDTPPKFSFDQWLAHMKHDKKVLSGQMRFITLAHLGQAQISNIDSPNILQATLQPYLP